MTGLAVDVTPAAVWCAKGEEDWLEHRIDADEVVFFFFCVRVSVLASMWTCRPQFSSRRMSVVARSVRRAWVSSVDRVRREEHACVQLQSAKGI